MQSLKINGQRWDLEANPDLLYEILISMTNLEERLRSLDKRLRNLEKNPSKNKYKIIKKV